MLISKAAGKSCQLDPIPTPIFLKLLDVLLPVITKLINLSFDTGRFAEACMERGACACITISQEAWFGLCVQKFPSSQ